MVGGNVEFDFLAIDGAGTAGFGHVWKDGMRGGVCG